MGKEEEKRVGGCCCCCVRLLLLSDRHTPTIFIPPETLEFSLESQGSVKFLFRVSPNSDLHVCCFLSSPSLDLLFFLFLMAI